MTKFDLLAVFDLTATILLLVWSTNLLITTLKLRAEERAEAKTKAARKKRAAARYKRRLIKHNREVLWGDLRRNLI